VFYLKGLNYTPGDGAELAVDPQLHARLAVAVGTRLSSVRSVVTSSARLRPFSPAEAVIVFALCVSGCEHRGKTLSRRYHANDDRCST
jgi:hypothetical protein